jgi:ParB family chromosome partitioning protein
MQDHRMEKDENGQQLQVSNIPLNLIDANPFQPRRVFNEEEISELAETIKKHGLIQPITVRKYNGRYQIVSGERRTRAARIAGLTEIKAYVHELLSDKNMSEWALIENIQRVDLNPIELAESYQMLLENHNYTHEDLSETLGKSRSAITNSLRLLKLPEQVKTWVEEGKLSSSAARSLLSPEITDPEEVARNIIEKGMNVREIEKITKKKKEEKNTSPEIDADMISFQNKLQEFFGTKISINPSSKNKNEGIITIHYYSMDDLNHLQEIIERS